MSMYSIGHKFHDLNYLNFFFHIPIVYYTFESSIFFVENHQFNVILSYLKQLF